MMLMYNAHSCMHNTHSCMMHTELFINIFGTKCCVLYSNKYDLIAKVAIMKHVCSGVADYKTELGLF